MKFEIAGLILEIFSDHSMRFFEIFDDFRTLTLEPASLRVRLCPVTSIAKPQGTAILDDANKWIINTGPGQGATVYKCSRRDPGNEPIYTVEVTDQWTDATVTFLKENQNIEQEVVLLLSSILLKNLLILQQGISIHASAISLNGKGIIFTAPSETGKSTQADLWARHKKATILNDDSPAIRLIGDQVMVYGTPWGGSRRIFQNDQVPLEAIIVLEQSAENSIRKLPPAESIPMLLPRCFMPYHDQQLMDTACAILENIVMRLPIYHFKCRPDRDAVEVVSGCLK